MPRREPASLAVLFLVLLAVAACGSGEDAAPVDAAPPVASASERAVSGTYQVEGVTVQALSGQQREISGTLHLEVAAGRYDVDFELQTMAPDFEEPVPVQVRGSGRGFVVGKVLTGTTEEWMTLVPPPGGLGEVELRGVQLPARAGRKIVSTSQASFDGNGTFHIVLQNYPGPGERYEPSMTVLEGQRSGDLPPAEARPPADG